jgi:hypothetical protein
MPVATTQNDQVIDAVVTGPNGANRLYICTGQAWTVIWQPENRDAIQTFTFLIGPELPRPQFVRATGTASVAAYALYDSDPAANGWHSLAFESVEADWDDESRKTEMRVEVRVQTGPGTHLSLARIGYSATVLAELPAA